MHRTHEETRSRKARAMIHISFVCELYDEQVRMGRYFLHEHPAQASSWDELPINRMLSRPNVRTAVMDQCQYGLKDKHGNPMRKPTKWMSNSQAVLSALEKRCEHQSGYCSARGWQMEHTPCFGDRATRAAVHSHHLCRAILTGIQNQLQADGRHLAGNIGIVNKYEEYIDDLTKQPLDSMMVRAARRTELDFFKSKDVWEIASEQEARRNTGRPPISVRWVDVNKGDDITPNYRSRLVARDIRKAGEDPIFAPTPPLEAVRMVLSAAATEITNAEGEQFQGPVGPLGQGAPHRRRRTLLQTNRKYIYI